VRPPEISTSLALLESHDDTLKDDTDRFLSLGLFWPTPAHVVAELKL
jgi:hypothetical protein